MRVFINGTSTDTTSENFTRLLELANIRLGEFTTLSDKMVLGNNIAIGSRTSFKEGIVIGDNVTIGNDVKILSDLPLGMVIPNATVIDKVYYNTQTGLYRWVYNNVEHLQIANSVASTNNWEAVLNAPNLETGDERTMYGDLVELFVQATELK